MLKFIKKLLAKEEKKEEKISLDELDSWLDRKTKPIIENLNNHIINIKKSIDDEKEKALQNIKKLEGAKLQNPNIPERAKTVMQGNRQAFIKKVSDFFNSIDLQYGDFYGLIDKCNALEQQLDSLAKSTSRSYQILSQFFAREIAVIAENTKKIESSSKEIRNLIENSKIAKIDGIKGRIKEIKSKIRQKEDLSRNIAEEKAKLENFSSKTDETENRINKTKDSDEYKIYENMLKERESLERGLNDIESKVFHDFSVLDKALKKYAKIAFDNEQLIKSYLSDPIKALAEDNSLGIIKTLGSLKEAIEGNKLELEQKKNEKSLGKIKELNREYFLKMQEEYKKIRSNLEKINTSIENNSAKKQLEHYNKELDNIKNIIEGIKNKISNDNNELEKISIGRLKESLQEEIREALNERIIIL